MSFRLQIMKTSDFAAESILPALVVRIWEKTNNFPMPKRIYINCRMEEEQ